MVVKPRQPVEPKGKLYSITEQLLKARDMEFLSKAALCLLMTGEQDEYSAQLLLSCVHGCVTLSYMQDLRQSWRCYINIGSIFAQEAVLSYTAQMDSKGYQQQGVVCSGTTLVQGTTFVQRRPHHHWSIAN